MSPNPIDMESTANGITTYWQDVPPAHYTLKFGSFSLFLGENIDHFETSMFESGGYKWKLSLYPNGNNKRNVTDHISLYLAISDIDALPIGWLVNVTFKFFLYNHICDKYLTFQDAEESTTHLYKMKTVIGFDELVSLATLKEVSNGFLLEDCCIFGAEVYVKKYNGHGECISMIKDPPNNTFTWKIHNFPQLAEEAIYSDVFVVEDNKWKLCLYPEGNGTGKGECISLFLFLVDDLPSDQKVLAKFIIQIKGNNSSNCKQCDNAEESTTRLYVMKTVIGFDKLVSLATLKEPSNGFLLEDCCIFGAEVFVKKFDCHGECISMIKDLRNNTFTWKILNFSQISEEAIYSKEFVVGGYTWKLQLYPKGNGVGKGKCISVFLKLVDDLPSERNVLAKFMLKIKGNNSFSDENYETGHKWFCNSCKFWGYPEFCLLEDINKPSNLFLVNGNLTVEAKITLVSTHKDF